MLGYLAGQREFASLENNIWTTLNSAIPSPFDFDSPQELEACFQLFYAALNKGYGSNATCFDEVLTTAVLYLIVCRGTRDKQTDFITKVGESSEVGELMAGLWRGLHLIYCRAS